MGRLAVQPPNRVQRFVDSIGTLNYSSGGSPFVDLPSNDYTTYLELLSAQQVVVGTTAPVIAGYGAFGPEQLVQVVLPGGKTPYALPGYVGDLYSRIRNHPYDSQMTTDPVAVSSTNNWINHLQIPFTLTPDSDRGAWYTGDTAVQMQLRLTCAPAATVFSTVNGATIQGSWEVGREFFNAPPPNQSAVWLDAISWYHEILQVNSGVSLPAQIPIQRDLDYQRLIMVFYTGNNSDSTFAPADGLYTSADLAIDTTIHIFTNNEEQQIRFEDLLCYDTILPPGTAVFDFERIENSVRDILPTDTNTVTLVQLSITGPSTTKMDLYAERVSDNPYAAKWLAIAAAQGSSTTSGQTAAA